MITNKTFQKSIIAITTSFLVSCGTYVPLSDQITNVMKTWVGHHKSELIQKWGPASKITSDGKGGEVYTYYYARNKKSTSYVVYGTLVTNDNSYSAERHFYINDKGIIYHWRWKGH